MAGSYRSEEEVSTCYVGAARAGGFEDRPSGRTKSRLGLSMGAEGGDEGGERVEESEVWPGIGGTDQRTEVDGA
jgi:hypothetical protein